MAATENSSGGLFDNDVGENVHFEMDGKTVAGTVTEVERGSPVDEYPEVGEMVTFKAVGGDVEKTVIDVNEDDKHPITLEHSGSYRRTNFVEYTEHKTYKIVELTDGTEVWPEIEGEGE